MIGAPKCGPDATQITQLGFDAVDVKAHGSTPGENQRDDAPRSGLFFEFDRKQIQHGISRCAPDVQRLDGCDVFETDCRPAAFVGWPPGTLGRHRPGPIKSVNDGRKPPLLALINDIAYLEHSVLQLRREDDEVILVESHEFQRLHGVVAHSGSAAYGCQRGFYRRTTRCATCADTHGRPTGMGERW